MKKLATAALIVSGLLGAAPARACDICGCGVSNYNPYLFPHLSKNYIGFTWVHRSFRTRPYDASSSSERYNSLIVSSQYSIGKKIQVMALLPWQINGLTNDAGRKDRSGPGDITVLGQYRLWDHTTKTLRHTVLLGGGVKLATGKYTPATSGKPEDQNFQLGTGSTDFLLNGSYRISLRKWVFGASCAYKFNTGNEDRFRFGDVVNLGVLAVYRQEWAKVSLSPYLQLSHESQFKDADDHVLQKHSGGTIFYAGGGLDLNTRQLTVGMGYQWAADGSLAAGQIEVGPKLTAHASFSF